MISVTYTHRNGVELLEPVTIAIDPEKISDVRDRGAYAEIDYAETYDRRRQPIVYQLTTDRAAILATIFGNYSHLTHPYLALTVLWSNDRDYRPGSAGSYALDLQEKYIVDIRDTYCVINNVKTACRRIEFVPASFVPVVIYVSDAFNTLILSTPAAVTTTTTTAAATTTTTTAAATTTTTTEAATTTTTTAAVTTTTTTAAG